MTSFCIYKVVVYIESVTCIHIIFHYIICSSFHMERRDGIWTYLCNSIMGMPHTVPRRSYQLHICPFEVEPQNLFKGGRLFQ